MSEFPQIDIGKRPGEVLNISYMAPMPNNTPFGNLSLKLLRMVMRLDRVNVEIEKVFRTYVHPSQPFDLARDITEHQHYSEQVVYWLRKTADEIVGLAYVLDERQKAGAWPQRVDIDSIGRLNNRPSASLKTLFEPYMRFLETLNSVSNAYKHSFINSDMNLMGAEYPVVYALGLKRNDLSKEPQFYSLAFAEVVSEFSAFYVHSMSEIKNWGITVRAAEPETR